MIQLIKELLKFLNLIFSPKVKTKRRRQQIMDEIDELNQQLIKARKENNEQEYNTIQGRIERCLEKLVGIRRC